MRHVWRFALGTMILALVFAARAVWEEIGPIVGPWIERAMAPTAVVIVVLIIVYCAGWLADYLLRGLPDDMM